MNYALKQLTEFPLATNTEAANFNTAPKVANLNRAPISICVANHTDESLRAYYAFQSHCN